MVRRSESAAPGRVPLGREEEGSREGRRATVTAGEECVPQEYPAFFNSTL